MSTSATWLINEDSSSFEDRLSRLGWLTTHSPGGEYWTFPGGLHAKSVFEEARYCFVYAQFLATILLSLAYIELTLAACSTQQVAMISSVQVCQTYLRKRMPKA